MCNSPSVLQRRLTNESVVDGRVSISGIVWVNHQRSYTYWRKDSNQPDE
jgi:hypothetical protein